MKKVVLLAIGLIAIQISQAQDFEFIIHEDTAHGFNNAHHVDSEFDVINTSGANVDVTCTKNVVTSVPGMGYYFCWGPTCYSVNDDVSTDLVTVNDADTNFSFISYVLLNFDTTLEGYSAVEYCFDGPGTASVCTTSHYVVTKEVVSGVMHLNSEVSYLKAFPNPANDLVNLVYTINMTENSRAVVRNIIGEEMFSQYLVNKIGQIELNTTDFPTGLYFYSVETGAGEVRTEKMIVSH